MYIKYPVLFILYISNIHTHMIYIITKQFQFFFKYSSNYLAYNYNFHPHNYNFLESRYPHFPPVIALR